MKKLILLMVCVIIGLALCRVEAQSPWSIRDDDTVIYDPWDVTFVGNPVGDDGDNSATITVATVSDTAYSVGWNGDTTTAASKNALYDKIEVLAGGHDAVTLAADADVLLGLSTQEVNLDSQNANVIFGGPASGAAADPTFRSLVDDDIPDTITIDLAATATALVGGEVDPTVDTDDEIIAIINVSPSTQIKHEAGGLEADVSAYNGFVKISGGSTSAVTANAGTDITADLEEETHASEHAVGGADTIFPADPNADKYLMWDDDPGNLSWGTPSGGSGAFSDAGDPVVLNTTTKDVVIGTGAVNTSKLTVDGDADQVQLTVQGNATQTNSLFIAEQSGGTEVLNLTNAGALTLASTVSITENSRSTQLPGVENTGTITAIAGQGYSNLRVVSGTTPDEQIDIDADYLVLRDANDVVFVAKTVNETVDNTVSGLNGIDTGSVANSTWYTVWIIAKEDGTVDSLLSVSTTIGTITLPSGYVYGKRVGWGLTDATSDFFDFRQVNGYLDYAERGARRVVDGGSAESFTNVDCSAYIPATAYMGKFLGEEGGSNQAVEFRWNGATGSNGALNMVNGRSMIFYLATDNSQIIEYKIVSAGGALYLDIGGYIDNL